jgi:hypothetical protein
MACHPQERSLEKAMVIARPIKTLLDPTGRVNETRLG